MLYTTAITRDKVDSAIDFFFDTIAQPSFKPWELSDNTSRMALEVAELSNEAKAVELLHQAAYRTALGNSVFSPVHMVRYNSYLNLIYLWTTQHKMHNLWNKIHNVMTSKSIEEQET